MFRHCVKRLRATGHGLLPAALSVATLVLVGCASNPPLPEATPAQTSEPMQSQPEPPAAQTFPLEAESAQVRPTTAGPVATNTASTMPATLPSTPAAATTANGPGAQVEPTLPPEAVQQFDNAVAMANSGNVAAAEQAFRSLSTAYPAYSGPLVNLGILQAKAGQLDTAEKTLRSALERKADSATAYNQLGIVYRRQGRFKEADAAYTRAVQIDPSYANAYLNLGVLCDLYLQQPQRALEAFERYLSVSTTPDEKVSAWIKELKVRLGSAERAGAGA